ncbi:Pvc16 family protein [Nonomuraea sp. NPDC050556]|uniref:Pvc16 family protein n=1 Tax=Nonomuraea sp. NPDC050556 TaxID=3364369 RepID=UPI0037AA6E65
MSAATAIGMVSESLRGLLTGEMTLTPTVPVTVLAPDEAGGPRRINLFLYKIEENPTFKNADWQVVRGNPDRLAPPPLTLNLYYLMTAYAPNDAQNGNAAAHAILGEAMRVFHVNPVIPPADLVPGLQNMRERIQIFLNTLDLDELTNLWGAFTQPFRTSVLYEVSVVQLDQAAEAQRSTPKRVRSVGVPEVRAPFAPPTIDTVNPVAGPAGRTVTVGGTGLAGWQTDVSLSGTPLLTAHALTADAFTVTLPTALAQGFYELRVDISRLTRRTLFLEVTP